MIVVVPLKRYIVIETRTDQMLQREWLWRKRDAFVLFTVCNLCFVETRRTVARSPVTLWRSNLVLGGDWMVA